MSEVLLSLDDVRVVNRADGREIVHGVSLELRRGGVVGIVGESGSGKSITCRAVLGILPRLFEISGGSITLFGRDVQTIAAREWPSIRGRRIGAVFQDPGSYLNPSIRVGAQIAETLRVGAGLGRRQAAARALELLERVHLRDPRLVAWQYPHELSGGMLQRVLVAAAIALDPEILIADEATTALDVTVQAEILDLLTELREENGLALVVVSHDLAVVSQLCDEVLVMRDGRIVEHGPTEDVLVDPRHEYTRLLLREHRQYGLERFLSPGSPARADEREDADA